MEIDEDDCGYCLLEFRAGRMRMDANCRVVADPRKGIVRLQEEEGIMFVQWVDRESQQREEVCAVNFKEAIFRRVPQASGRVYALHIANGSPKFFWMQEPNAERDEELFVTANFFLNRDPPAEGEMARLDVSMDGESKMSMGETSGGPSVTAAAVETLTAAAGALPPTQPVVQLADLQRILSNIGQPYDDAGTSNFIDGGPSLSELLKPEDVLPLLDGCHLKERLSPYLPEGEWSVGALSELMQSPQFRQQLDTFTQVLRSGQIDMSQFGIDPSRYDFTVASFLEAIDDEVNRRKEKDGMMDE